MSKARAIAVGAAFLFGWALQETALAGDWRHDGAFVVVAPRSHAPNVPWHDQHPWVGTGVGFYYGQHPDHIPSYPKPLTGHAVPIFDTGAPLGTSAPRYRIAPHSEWCVASHRVRC